MPRVASLLIVALLLLAGCDMPFSAEDVQKSPEGILLQRVVDELRAKKLDAIRQESSEKLITEPNFARTLATAAALVPSEESKSVSITAWEFNLAASGERTAAITAAYEYVDYVLQVSIATQSEGSQPVIESIDVQRIVQATVGNDLSN